MNGVIDRINQDGNIGVASLKVFSISEEESRLTCLRRLMGNPFAYCKTGNYVKLIVNGNLMMSDTDMEKNSNIEFCKIANGDVMIAGLGIGLILHNIADKCKSGIVKSITIFEKYKDVIDLVSPYYKDLPIRYVEQDILEYKPRKGEMYDVIYFDIWPDINTDNLNDIRLLHNRWKNHLNRNNPNCYMESWMKKFLQKRKLEEEKNNNWF